MSDESQTQNKNENKTEAKAMAKTEPKSKSKSDKTESSKEDERSGNDNAQGLNVEASEFVPVIVTGTDTDTQDTKQYNHSEIIASMVQFQVEYHFSDANLSMDNYLLSRMHEDKNYWVSVKQVANLTKIKALTDSHAVVLKAIEATPTLELSNDKCKVRRVNYVPPKPRQHKDLRRTVFLYGLTPELNAESVAAICAEFGNVKHVVFDCDTPSPSKSQSASIDTDTDKTATVTDTDTDDKNNNNNNNNNKKKATLTLVTPTKPGLKNGKSATAMAMQIEDTKNVKKTSSRFSSLRGDADTGGDVNNNTDVNRRRGGSGRQHPRCAAVISDIEAPSREVALVVMAKRFGPRLALNASNTGGVSARETNNDTNHSCGVAPLVIESPLRNKQRGTALSVSAGHQFQHPRMNPNGNPHDFTHLRSAFVVFESQSQANKCVKARMRANDGIRAMHQYDFNKTRKKVSAAKARGISPLVSPLLKSAKSTQKLSSSSMRWSPSPVGSVLNTGQVISANKKGKVVFKFESNWQLPAPNSARSNSSHASHNSHNSRVSPGRSMASNYGGSGGHYAFTSVSIANEQSPNYSYGNSARRSTGQYSGSGRFPKSKPNANNSNSRFGNVSSGHYRRQSAPQSHTGRFRDLDSHNSHNVNDSRYQYSRHGYGHMKSHSSTNAGKLRRKQASRNSNNSHSHSHSHRGFLNRASGAGQHYSYTSRASHQRDVSGNGSGSGSDKNTAKMDASSKDTSNSGGDNGVDSQHVARGPDGSRGFAWARNEHGTHKDADTAKNTGNDVSVNTLQTKNGSHTAPTPTSTPQWLQQQIQFAQIQHLLLQQPEFAAQYFADDMKKWRPKHANTGDVHSENKNNTEQMVAVKSTPNKNE